MNSGSIFSSSPSSGAARTTFRVRYRPGNLAWFLVFACSSPFLQAVETLRVDYYHTAGRETEVFSLDRVVIEPLPWPGPPDKVLDETNLGLYFFEVRELSSNRLLYSRGFSSICGEWQTTGEAESRYRTFQESLRFPRPQGPVQVLLKKRHPEGRFYEIWNFSFDPSDSMTVSTARPPSPGALIEIQKSGDPVDKVDFLMIGDGYTRSERGKCEADARRFGEVLFRESPFRERRQDFNLWALCPESTESGISRPSTGVHRSSAVGTTYDVFGSERYALTFDNRAFREVASFAPYEFVEILINNRTYGGGGIFGLYGTVAVDNAFAEYVFIHEFAHHFAALADEYYTSAVAYQSNPDRPEPWERNVTAMKDPSRLKWKDLVAESTLLPTPWPKTEYEEHALEIQRRRADIRSQNLPEQVMEELFREQSRWEEELFSKTGLGGRVGAFEGAMYEGAGYFRPQLDCIMFTRNRVPFCSVCQRSLSQIIDLYTR